MDATQAIFDALMNLGLPGLIMLYLVNEVNQLKKEISNKGDEIELLNQRRLEDWRYFSDKSNLIRTISEGDTKPFSQAGRIAAAELVG